MTLAVQHKRYVCVWLIVILTSACTSLALDAQNISINSVGNCSIDSQCNDSNACTVDQCANNMCTFTPMMGCTPCTSNPICPSLDVVFIMDTSGSMADEAAALCTQMNDVIADLALDGINVTPLFLGITEAPGRHFSCLTSDVVTMFGPDVPGNGGTCQFPDTFSSRESWGPATAIVAAEYPWTPGSQRLIIPISDEGSCDGSFPNGCSDPGADRDAITNAMVIASTNGVMVAPIIGTGADSCVLQLATDLAEGTGGTVHQAFDPGIDLAGIIVEIMQGFCVDSCDDKQDCTVNDTCSQSGICTGIPIDSFGCVDDVDCLNSVCDQVSGVCSCVLTPDLRILGADPSITCYSPGEVVEVHVALGVSSAAILGGQFNIQYDPGKLKFISVAPGSTVDSNSPFSVQLAKIVDETAGSVFYAVGTPFFNPGSHGDVPMVVVTFQALTACDMTGLCFISDGPKDTLLTDTKGSSIPFTPGCLDLRITGAPAEIVCPSSVVSSLDAGVTTATILWEAPAAVGGCDGPLMVDCSATNSGFAIDPNKLITGGGVFLPDHYEFQCMAQDSCGAMVACQWTVDVSDTHLMEFDVELSPPIVADQLDRCLELVIYSNCVLDPLTIEKQVTFVRQQTTAVAQLSMELPRGSYSCVTARDSKHTLPSSSSVSIVNNVYTSACVGDPLLNGNWLIGGNLDGNDAIDLLDLAALIAQMNQSLDPNTTCGMTGIHADINGDGIVDALDEAFVLDSFNLIAPTTCCPLVVPTSDANIYEPVTSLTLKELRGRGWTALEAADVNADGSVDTAELVTFGHRRSATFGQKIRSHKTSRRRPDR